MPRPFTTTLYLTAAFLATSPGVVLAGPGHGGADQDYDGVFTGPTIDLHARYPGDKAYPFGNSRVAGPDRGPYVEKCYWTAVPNEQVGFFFPSKITQHCVRSTLQNVQQ